MIHLPNHKDSAASKTNQTGAAECNARRVWERSNDARDKQQR
jgi:hypothetical protein